MSNGNLTSLSSCGCCQGEPDFASISNRPGLSALSYRIGTYGVFFQRLLDQIHSYVLPDGDFAGTHPLGGLTTRSQDDPAIALLDGWAIIADVLTFYQERIANEGYLRTATERRSVLELAREIGYELSPGVAASAYLQFTVEEIIGTAPPPSVTIPGVRTQPPAGPGSSAFNSGIVLISQGTQVQSVPAPGQAPQTFETAADFSAQVEWNTLKPRQARQPDLALDSHGNLYLLAASSGFGSGSATVQLAASDIYLLNPLTALNLMSPSFVPLQFNPGSLLHDTFAAQQAVFQPFRSAAFRSAAVLASPASSATTLAAEASAASLAVKATSATTLAARATPVETLAAKVSPAAMLIKEPFLTTAVAAKPGLSALLPFRPVKQLPPAAQPSAPTVLAGPTVKAIPINFLYLQGTSTNIKPGDKLLLVGLQNGSTQSATFIVRTVTPDSISNNTLVQFATSVALPSFAPGSFPPTDLKLQGIAFNQNNVSAYILSKTVSEPDLQAFLQLNQWDAEELMTLVNNPPPPTASEQGAYSFAAKAALFGNNAPLWKTLPKPSTSQRDDPFPLNWDSANNGLGRSVWTDSQGNPLADGDAYLDRAYPQVVAKSWAVFEAPNIATDAAFEVTHVTEKSAADYNLSGRTTALTLKLKANSVGIGISSPSAVAWSANRLDAFVIGFDGHLYHRWWNGSSWGGPEDLGGANFINSPSVASWAANRLDVFAIGSDGHLYHKFWDGSRWGGPEDLGGGNLVNSASAVSWAANRLDIFAIGSDGCLYHKFWDGSNWGGLENLGGGNLINTPSAVAWAANRLDIFAIGSDGALYHKWWGGSGWGGPENLGGDSLINSPSAVAWAANRLDVFAIGSDGFLYHKWWDGNNWGGLENLGGGHLVDSPSVASWAANRLDVFAINSSGNLRHKWWDGNSWGGLEDLGGNGNMIKSPSAVSWASGRLDIFMVGASGHWFHKWWQGGWGGPEDLGDGSLALFPVRKTVAWVQSQQQSLASVPVTDEIVAGSTQMMLDEMVIGLAPGKPVSLSGTQSDPPGVTATEILFLDSVTHVGGFTVLAFTTGLQNSYIRSSVTLNANLALATHGATVQEVLGSGDGSQTNQTFSLKRPPLTYISAPTPSGTASTLQVRVNGLAWSESPSLYGLTASDQEYIVRLGDDGTPSVKFGDPAARLRTGMQNVTATYRTGIGVAGNVAAGSLSLLQSRPPGLRGVTNPLPAGGGADPQNLADARSNAPLTVLTLERIVSLDDYQSFAQSFAGIGKAQAVAVWSGETHVIQITVAGVNGAAISPIDPLYRTLLQAIQLAHDPVQTFVVSDHQPRTFNLKAAILIDQPKYLPSVVMAGLNAALTSAFAFSQRAFAQAVTAAEILKLMQSIPGVIAVDLNQLYLTSDSTGPNQTEPLPFLTALPAHFVNGAIQPAQLLLLNPLGVTLTEISS